MGKSKRVLPGNRKSVRQDVSLDVDHLGNYVDVARLPSSVGIRVSLIEEDSHLSQLAPPGATYRISFYDPSDEKQTLSYRCCLCRQRWSCYSWCKGKRY